MEPPAHPAWIETIFNEFKAEQLVHIMTKTIEASDLADKFRLYDEIIERKLIGYITKDEMVKVLQWGKGLDVLVFINEELWFDLFLKRLDDCLDLVLVGDEMKEFLHSFNLLEADIVEIWMFRLPEEDLTDDGTMCFAIDKHNNITA